MKRKIINSFLILSLSSTLSKLFSICNRMLLTRLLPKSAISLYFVIMPTLSLCITLAQLGIPSAVFRLMIDKKNKSRKIIWSAFMLSIITTTIICMIMFISTPYITNSLLKNKDVMYPMYSFLLFIPLVAISGIIKSFLLSKNHLYVITKTQIIEEISRFIFMYLMLKQPLYTSDVFCVTVAYVSMSVGELCSIIYMMIRIKHQYALELCINPKYDFLFKDILNISLPLTGTRLYHSFVSFLEPIILLFLLTNIHLSKNYIQSQYAIISGFVISLLVTPTFFCNVVYRIYLPIVIDDLSSHMFLFKKHFILALLSCFAIGLPFTCIFFFFPKQSLQLLFHTTSGYQVLKMICFPFLLFYLQTPLTTIMHALHKDRTMFLISVIECTIEILMTCLLCRYLYVNVLVFSLFIGLLTTFILTSISIYKALTH